MSRPASLSTCWITNDPAARFRVQAGNSTTVGFVQADVGMNAQFGYGVGNPANGLSGAFIDMAVARAVTPTFPFRVIGADPRSARRPGDPAPAPTTGRSSASTTSRPSL